MILWLASHSTSDSKEEIPNMLQIPWEILKEKVHKEEIPNMVQIPQEMLKEEYRGRTPVHSSRATRNRTTILWLASHLTSDSGEEIPNMVQIPWEILKEKVHKEEILNMVQIP